MQTKTKTFLTLLLIFILGAGFQQVIAVNAAMAEQDAATAGSVDAAKAAEEALDKDDSEADYEEDEDYDDEDYDDEDEDDEDYDDDDDELEAQAAPTLTAAEAEAIALSAVPGEVSETEPDVEDNRLVYEVEIGNQEVLIDANSGDVIAVEVDD